MSPQPESWLYLQVCLNGNSFFIYNYYANTIYLLQSPEWYCNCLQMLDSSFQYIHQPSTFPTNRCMYCAMYTLHIFLIRFIVPDTMDIVQCLWLSPPVFSFFIPSSALAPSSHSPAAWATAPARSLLQPCPAPTGRRCSGYRGENFHHKQVGNLLSIFIRISCDILLLVLRWYLYE